MRFPLRSAEIKGETTGSLSPESCLRIDGSAGASRLCGSSRVINGWLAFVKDGGGHGREESVLTRGSTRRMQTMLQKEERRGWNLSEGLSLPNQRQIRNQIVVLFEN